MALYGSCIVWGTDRKYLWMRGSCLCFLFGVAVGMAGLATVDGRWPADGELSDRGVGSRRGAGGGGGQAAGEWA